jgi:D-glycerate 3-kinase
VSIPLSDHRQALAATMARWHAASGRPLLVGLSGAQGSGKSTLAAFLVQHLRAHHGLRAAALSLDDVYLTRAERQHLAVTVHPLFATRGPPGTHDLALFRDIVSALRQGHGEIAVPRFLKAADDRAPRADWTCVEAPVDVILFEGWCLGARPQADAALQTALNPLEAEEDPHLLWRRHVNEQLAGPYASLWASLDRFVLLQAPSWPVVCRWRAEAEAGLPGGAVMSPALLGRFMAHYERTGRSLLQCPPEYNLIWHLDEGRSVLRVEERW